MKQLDRDKALATVRRILQKLDSKKWNKEADHMISAKFAAEELFELGNAPDVEYFDNVKGNYYHLHDRSSTVRDEAVIQYIRTHDLDDTAIHDIIICLAGMYLEAGEAMPWELSRIAGESLLGKRKRPRRHGPDPDKNIKRDYLICWAIETLKDKGTNPTRSRHSKTDRAAVSGCDIVAAILAERGERLSYAAIESIWIADLRWQRQG